MRSSRRRQGLNPELIPSPTPSNSDGSDFVQDFQIETTIEEEDRLRWEEQDHQLSSDKQDENSQDIEDTSMTNVEKDKDVVLSSDSSDDVQSEELILIKDKKKSDVNKSS